jgi:uncharacterized protein YhaN
MRHAVSDSGGTTFPVGRIVEVMDSHAGSPIPDGGVELLLGDVIRGERARALRAQLASSHPRQSAEQIEEAVQAACEDFVAQGETISEPGTLYAWVRTVAYRKLAREDEHGRHELPVDPTEGTLERAASEEPGPAEELIALEDDMDVETDTEAVRAREDVELALSRVEAAALAYARARLAATVVRRAIERYRDAHESPMLGRTKALFRRFTQNACSDLYVEVEDGGKAVLIAREFDGALKRIDQLSKGTREQLYLALRVAAIERYVETTGPVPVTFDDVFSESDEPRSQRIFEALGELADKTQVTVLTHHRYLIEVGERALGGKLVVQELPSVAPSLRVAEAA